MIFYFQLCYADLRSWRQLMQDGLTTGLFELKLMEAFAVVSTGVQGEVGRCSKDRHDDWRRRLRLWNDGLWKN